GFQEFQVIVKTFHSIRPLGGDADYSDLWSAAKEVLQDGLSKNLMPEDGDEFYTLVQEHLRPRVGRRGFAISMFGLSLDDTRTIALGNFTLVPPSSKALEEVGVPVGGKHWSPAMQHLGYDPVLVGFAFGTERVARRRFFSRAELLVGLIAVFVS